MEVGATCRGFNVAATAKREINTYRRHVIAWSGLRRSRVRRSWGFHRVSSGCCSPDLRAPDWTRRNELIRLSGQVVPAPPPRGVHARLDARGASGGPRIGGGLPLYLSDRQSDGEILMTIFG